MLAWSKKHRIKVKGKKREGRSVTGPQPLQSVKPPKLGAEDLLRTADKSSFDRLQVHLF